MHSNTAVHHAILGCLVNGSLGRDATRRARQSRVLELLLWPQAFMKVELMQRLNPGDPAMANSRGETPIELAVRQGAEELVVHLLDWDSDMQQRASNTGQLGADGELGASSTNELSSLSNLYNLHSGDTPALASLREGARFLRLIGDCNSSVQNEHALMDQLMVTQKLVQHAHTNLYQSTISLANSGLASAAAGSSGASLLLFLLATSDGIERRMSFSDVTANRREVLQEALELANNLAFQVIDKVERGKRVDELQNLLFVLLPGSAWRIFDSTGKIRCLTLMLSGSRQQLVEHERVQEAIQLAWSSSSRFAFLLSSGFFCCIVLSLSFAGWDGLNSPELRTSVEGALGLPLEATTTPTFWFDWLRNTVLPQAIMSHRDLGLNSARFDAESAWFAADGLQFSVETQASATCGTWASDTDIDLTYGNVSSIGNYCNAIALGATNASSLPVVTIIPIHLGVVHAQAALDGLEATWKHVATTAVFGVEINLLLPRESVLSVLVASLSIDSYGRISAEHSFESIILERGTLTTTIVLASFGGLACTALLQLRDIYAEGWLHFRGFNGNWNILNAVRAPPCYFLCVVPPYLTSHLFTCDRCITFCSSLWWCSSLSASSSSRQSSPPPLPLRRTTTSTAS